MIKHLVFLPNNFCCIAGDVTDVLLAKVSSIFQGLQPLCRSCYISCWDSLRNCRMGDIGIYTTGTETFNFSETKHWHELF